MEKEYTEKEAKGIDFERFVINCFHFKERKAFKLIEWQGDKIDINGVYPESNRNPDMVIQMTVGGYKYWFAIECKYRSKVSDDGYIYWANKEKIGIYNIFSEERQIPVFVMIGIGGTSNNPEEVFIVPLQYLKSGKVKYSALELFKRRDPASQIYYSGPKMILY